MQGWLGLLIADVHDMKSLSRRILARSLSLAALSIVSFSGALAHSEGTRILSASVTTLQGKRVHLESAAALSDFVAHTPHVAEVKLKFSAIGVRLRDMVHERLEQAAEGRGVEHRSRPHWFKAHGQVGMTFEARATDASVDLRDLKRVVLGE
jgi:hypothetical protein